MDELISRQDVIDVRGKRVLDPCCGSRMFWFDKENKDVVFCDNRELHTTLCDGRKLDISPDIMCDFTDLPFEDNTFYHVVFDPPHMNTLGKNSWMAKKYGTLKGENWQKLIREGFWECMRVLKPNGTLIFKWNEQDIPVSMVLKTIGARPMYGHKSGKLQKTHWMAFLKQGGTGAHDIGELPSAPPDVPDTNVGDMISRQVAIDALEERLQANGYSNAALVSELNRCIGYLMQLPSAQPEEPQWIPCSERLPEARRSVILSTKEWTGEGCYWETTEHHVIWKGYRWNATYWDDEVLAWMPLPEPYKERREE